MHVLRSLLLPVPFFCCGFVSIAIADLSVGFILPLSGSAAAIGNACRNAITLADEESKAASSPKVTFYFEDDQLTTRNTVAAYHKLRPTINAVVTSAAGPSHAIAPLAEKDGLLQLAISSDHSVVKNRKFVFAFWVSGREQARVLVREANRRGYQRIARFTTQQEGALQIRDYFDAESSAIKVVVDKMVAPDLQDFRPLLLTLRDQSVDAIFVNLFFGQPGIFARQAREIGIEVPLFGVPTIENRAEISQSNGALVGAWYVQAEAPKSDFLARFTSKYPGSSTMAIGNCYDTYSLFRKAAISGVKDSLGLVTYLKTLKEFEGTLGTFSADGANAFTLSATVKVVTKEGFKEVVEADH
jgi:branched-chain amino acid transport system substrate-binding protein